MPNIEGAKLRNNCPGHQICQLREKGEFSQLLELMEALQESVPWKFS